MRDLVKNMTPIWYVEVIGQEEQTDGDGNYTGIIVKEYGEPVESAIAMYPYSGVIVEQTFGKDVSLDMIGSSSTLELKSDTLVFLKEPTTDYEKTYDFSISKMLISLNSTMYGFKRRT